VGTLSPVDAAALGLMAVAVLRGTWIGLIRESFSLGALAAACLAVRFGAAPAAAALGPHLPSTVPELWVRVACGAALALLAIAVVGGAGRLLRRGARAVGLGLADRVGGALLGAAEGALVVTLLTLLGVGLLGRSSPTLRGTQTLAWVERAESLARPGPPLAVDVSAAPPSPRAAQAAGEAEHR
jgi:uncharacterized membrane protein required for colicin V production